MLERLQVLCISAVQPRAGATCVLARGQGRATGAHLPWAPFAGGLGRFSPVHGVLTAWRSLVMPGMDSTLEIPIKLVNLICCMYIWCYNCTECHVMCCLGAKWLCSLFHCIATLLMLAYNSESEILDLCGLEGCFWSSVLKALVWRWWCRICLVQWHCFSPQSEDSFLACCAQWFERRCPGVAQDIVLSSHKCNRTVFCPG